MAALGLFGFLGDRLVSFLGNFDGRLFFRIRITATVTITALGLFDFLSDFLVSFLGDFDWCLFFRIRITAAVAIAANLDLLGELLSLALLLFLCEANNNRSQY